jgi:hypothetical protein
VAELSSSASEKGGDGTNGNRDGAVEEESTEEERSRAQESRPEINDPLTSTKARAPQVPFRSGTQ